MPSTPKQCIPDAGSQGPIPCGNYSKIKAKESWDSEPSSPILVLDLQSGRDIAETQLAVPEPQLPPLSNQIILHASVPLADPDKTYTPRSGDNKKRERTGESTDPILSRKSQRVSKDMSSVSPYASSQERSPLAPRSANIRGARLKYYSKSSRNDGRPSRDKSLTPKARASGLWEMYSCLGAFFFLAKSRGTGRPGHFSVGNWPPEIRQFLDIIKFWIKKATNKEVNSKFLVLFK